MANAIRVKRRAAGGASGAPASLENAELAFNEQDDTLYYGKGTGGAGGTATQVIPIAGPGTFVDKTTDQTLAGIKTFSSSPLVPTATGGDNSTKAASTAFVQQVISAASIPDGAKGDITVSGGGAAWEINAGAVTNTELANMGANTIKGRSATGGVPQDLSAGQVRTLLNVADGATANNTDAFLLDRANHTGSQAIGTVTGLQTALDGKAPSTSGSAILKGNGAGGTTAAVAGTDFLLPTGNGSALTGLTFTQIGGRPTTISQVEAEAGIATTDRLWTAERVNQAVKALAPVLSVSGKTGTVTLVKADVGLANVDNTSDVNKPVSTATQTALNAKIGVAQLGAANGVAQLGADQKLLVSQIPATAITDTSVIASQAAMLALTAQVGDVAVRTDILKSFILRAEPATVLGNWQELLTPTDSVQTVFGRAGTVIAQTGDYTVAQVTDAAPLASPALTGIPTAPTAGAAVNSTQIATTAYVKSQGYTTNVGTVTSVQVSGGTTGLTASGGPVTGSGTITLAGTLAVANGGTGTTTPAGARTALGLGTMSTQNANAVAIAGGTIDNVVFDGGTF